MIGYHYTNEAWYHVPGETFERGVTDEVIVLFGYGDDLDAEFVIRWHSLGSFTSPVPRVGIFEDAWHAFRFTPTATFLRLLDRLPLNARDPRSVIRLLDFLGFKDMTRRTR